MSSGISARLKLHKKPELMKSTSQILLHKLQQDGSMRTIENAMKKVEYVSALLLSKNIESTIPYRDDIHDLLQTSKAYGAYLDLLYAEQLNRCFIAFRNSSQDDERLDYLSRLYLLELIELRANGWKTNEITSQYYKRKASQYSQNETLDTASSLTDSMISSASSNVPLLAPGEIIKPSGKFPKPTRIAGKNYCKDEVVIRNADSGKVNPGAKERLVQITGANEESINHAKQLIEDTIRRNASPIREQSIVGGAPLTGSSSSINSSASDDSALPHSARASRTLLHSLSSNDASIGEYKYTVLVGNSIIKITGNNLDLVRTSKLVLDEYFSGEPIQDIGQFYSFDSLPQTVGESPLSPPESPSLPNGQLDESPGLRKPRTAIEDIIKGNIPPLQSVQTQKIPESLIDRHIYSIELLAQLAMSPLCLIEPPDWELVSTKFPYLVRGKDAVFFDAKKYLSNRSNEPYMTISIGSESEE